MSVTFTTDGAPDDLDVNMCNADAARVCESLDIELDPDWCGAMPAAEFLGRVLMALAISPTDEGMPAYEHHYETGRARMIEGSRRPGYLQDRLTDLHTLAQMATRNGTEVYWS